MPDLGDFDNFLSEDSSRDAVAREERSLQEGEVSLNKDSCFQLFRFRCPVMKRMEATPWWQDMMIL